MIIHPEAQKTWLAIMFLILLSCITYANTLQNAFVQDDYILIANNHFVKSWENLKSLLSQEKYLTPVKDFHPTRVHGSGELTYRPITTFSYFWDYSCNALNPIGYHITNIILHTFNVLLLFYLALLLLKKRSLAFIAAMLFSVHPINAETVSVINFREDLLTTLFFNAAFICYIGTTQATVLRKICFYLLSLCSFLLALLSKESAVVFPLILMLYDYFFVDHQRWGLCFRNFISRYALYMIFLAYYVITYWVFKLALSGYIQPYRGESFYANMLIILNVIATYLRWLIWPIDMHVALTEPLGLGFPYTIANFQNLFATMLVLGALSVGFLLRKKNAILSFSVFWFFITLIPVSNIVPLPTLIATHFLYLPMVGVALFGGELWRLGTHANSRWISSSFAKALTRIFFGVLLAMCFFITPLRNTIWQSNLSLWRECVRVYPKDPLAHTNYGIELKQIDGLLGHAIREFKLAAAIDPTNSFPHHELGVAYKEKEHYALAIDAFQKAVQINPQNLAAYFNLGWSYIYMKQWAEAQQVCREIEKVNPNLPQRYELQGAIAFEQGKIPESLGNFKKAVKLDPDNEKLWTNLGVIYFKMNQMEAARRAWEKALAIRPNDPVPKSFLQQSNSSQAQQKTE